jgi:hypothetical protein
MPVPAAAQAADLINNLLREFPSEFHDAQRIGSKPIPLPFYELSPLSVITVRPAAGIDDRRIQVRRIPGSIFGFFAPAVYNPEKETPPDSWTYRN